MESTHRSGHESRFRRVRRSLIYLALLAPLTSTAASQSNLSHDLAGKRFVGSLGPEGESEPQQEILTFDDGTLVSKICVQYGFDPAPYWVREDDEGLHFRAELESEDNGTIRLEGVFDGEELRASMLWKKTRWYWTVEQTLLFHGRPVSEAE